MTVVDGYSVRQFHGYWNGVRSYAVAIIVRYSNVEHAVFLQSNNVVVEMQFSKRAFANQT
jgi:hypothetical protein